MNYDLLNLFELNQEDYNTSVLNNTDKELLSVLEMSALETQMIDIRMQVELEDDELTNDAYDLTSHYSIEGIAETIKNKGSRALSGFITMSKKALNFVFGFIINLFKSSVNVKSVLKNVYEKAKKYDKEVDKLISKKFPDNFELESKDYSTRSNSSLLLLRGIIDMIQKSISKANESADDDAINRGIKLSLYYSSLIEALTSKESKVKPSDLIDDMIKKEGDVSKSSLINFFINKVKAGYEKLITFGTNSKDKTTAKLKFKFKTDPSGFITKLEEDTKKLSDLVELYKEDPASKTVKVGLLIPYFKKQLRFFLNICTKNNWDYSKSINELEKLRNKTIKSVDKVPIEENDEQTTKEIQAAMTLLSSMGKSMSSLTPLVRTLLSNIKSDIDNLITEIARVGSKASKID